ncbi:immunoglobulin-like domain-containing protein [Gracilibacillus sp. S3-1-1]|uniref:Immunoglobulin-like domain-containing protein n=1 Tax=Gracilibacillus pellucidus TaxID=3095368 RepID=A0ACC6M7D5_9BACI|nr:immunoglobulin-like domain-containing protein [Gracilibacillus sp. S3-1-1]MDX8046888.1 immunoglobulin-like domain-containing protein [Gracilibacillus sp. S3-1-1]
MSKQTKACIWFILVLFLFLAGCQEDLTETLSKSEYGDIVEQEEYKMTLEKDKYPENVDLITMEIFNNSDTDITFGLEHSVEIYVDGNWYQIPFKKDAQFQAIGVIVKPGESYSQNVAVDQLDFSFIPGRYRVIKPILPEVVVSAEFEIE